MRQETLEGRIGKFLAVKQCRAILDDVGDMLVGLGRHVHLPFHQHQQIRLVAGLAFGLHLDAGLFQLLLAGLLVGAEVIFVAGAPSENKVQIGVDEAISEPLPALLALEKIPIVEAERLRFLVRR